MSTTRPVVALAAAAIFGAVLTGCGGSNQDSAATTSKTTAPATATTASSTVTSTAPSTSKAPSSSTSRAPATGSDDDDGIAPSAASSSGITPVPHTALEGKQWAAATTCADRFAHAFARRKHDTQAAWWKRVKPYLTDDLSQVYRYTQISNIDVTKVTGKAQVRPIVGTPIDVALPVIVPTNAGVLTVTTITDDSGVHVSQVQFPGGGTS